MKYSRPMAHGPRELEKTRARLGGGQRPNVVPPGVAPPPAAPAVKPSLTAEQQAVADANRAMREAQKAAAEKLTPQEEARVAAAIELAKAATDPAPTPAAAPSLQAEPSNISTEGSVDATAEPEAGAAFEGALDDGEDAPEDPGKPEQPAASATDELLT